MKQTSLGADTGAGRLQIQVSRELSIKKKKKKPRTRVVKMKAWVRNAGSKMETEGLHLSL